MQSGATSVVPVHDSTGAAKSAEAVPKSPWKNVISFEMLDKKVEELSGKDRKRARHRATISHELPPLHFMLSAGETFESVGLHFISDAHHRGLVCDSMTLESAAGTAGIRNGCGLASIGEYLVREGFENRVEIKKLLGRVRRPVKLGFDYPKDEEIAHVAEVDAENAHKKSVQLIRQHSDAAHTHLEERLRKRSLEHTRIRTQGQEAHPNNEIGAAKE